MHVLQISVNHVESEMYSAAHACDDIANTPQPCDVSILFKRVEQNSIISSGLRRWNRRV